MSLSPEREQEIFNAVYENTTEFLHAYPKDSATLNDWLDSLLKQKSLSENHAVALRATAQAYQDEIKRQHLLKLITS